MPTELSAGVLEERLAGMFAELLGLSEVGPEDDFFALGGHSLTAGRLIGRIRSELDVELSLLDFFDGPTVRELSVLLCAQRQPSD
ncbi:phosphopantetheine-binding protein [Sphaerimonospora cavernae]|uniref:Phosphopantetheine-binding protein n=1 Tax=Sphaerimonospora cavernae TaxID=1740611 RepID=A0ABV6TZ12_9ACTN